MTTEEKIKKLLLLEFIHDMDIPEDWDKFFEVSIDLSDDDFTCEIKVVGTNVALEFQVDMTLGRNISFCSDISKVSPMKVPHDIPDDVREWVYKVSQMMMA